MSPTAPRPARKPISIERADPAADDRAGVDGQQHRGGVTGHPQHPADQPVVVEDREVGVEAGVGAGVDGDGAGERLGGADRDHAGRDQRVAEVLGGGGEAVVLLEPVAVEVGGGHLGAQLGVLGLQRAELGPQVAARAEPAGHRGDRTHDGGDAGLQRPEQLADRPPGGLHRRVVAALVVERHQRDAGEQQRDQQRAGGTPAAAVEVLDAAPAALPGRGGSAISTAGAR